MARLLGAPVPRLFAPAATPNERQPMRPAVGADGKNYGPGPAEQIRQCMRQRWCNAQGRFLCLPFHPAKPR